MGIVRICIVNARDSEPQKLPGLTGPMMKPAVFEGIGLMQNMWKGHRRLCNDVENAAVRLLGLCSPTGC